MAKFLKSFFQSDKRRCSKDEDVKNDFVPPLDDRRKLSISRSGRMKQNKKRPSINQEIFGEELQLNEGPELTDYHVHGKKYTEEQNQNKTRVKKKEEKRKLSASERKISLDERKTSASERKTSASERKISLDEWKISLDERKLSIDERKAITEKVEVNSGRKQSVFDMVKINEEIESAFKPLETSID